MAVDMNKISGNHSQQLDSMKLKSQHTSQTAKQQPVKDQGQPLNNSGPQEKDSVSLTSQAQQLHQIKDTLTNTSPVNQEKVDSIRKAIAAGEYKVDPQKLAANLAKFEGALTKNF